MRSRILCVALTLFCIFSLVERSQAGSLILQESDDEQLRTLLETRRDTLRRIAELIKLEVERGLRAYSELSAANLLLTEAEMEIAGSPAERVACFEKAYEVYNEVERMLEARANIGAAKASDVLLAKAARLKAKVELDEAKIELDAAEGKAGPDGTAEMRKTNDAAIQKLLEERYDTLFDVAELIQREVINGFGPVEGMSRANELLLEATLDLPDRAEGGIAILKRILADNTNVEKQFHAAWKANNLYEKNFLVAKAARFKAAINLHRAKKGEWPERMGRKNSRAAVIEEEPIDAELQTLLVEHRDTLKAVRQLFDKDLKDGVVRIAEMINAINAYFNAELELARTPPEQAAFLQEALKLQAEVERIAQAKFEIGTLREAEYLPAKAARMKVEIELHKARKQAQ